MDKEQIIEKLWEDSNHGTWREDIEAAYSAGVTAERERCAKQFVENGREIGRKEERERCVAHCDEVANRMVDSGVISGAEECARLIREA